MGANSDFRYDQQVFDTAIRDYQDVKNRFQRTKDILTRCIDSLREGWQSEAGDAFFADFDDDLSPSLDKYINFLSYLIESLQSAKTQYDSVVDKAASLRY